MFCSRFCNKLPKNVAFCNKCGAKLASIPIESPTSLKAKSKSKQIIVGAVAGIVILFFLIGIFAEEPFKPSSTQGR